MFTGLLGWWSDYFLDHRGLALTIRFFHLAALVVGGGTALYMDRKVLAARRRDESARRGVLSALHGAHPVVVPALIVMAMTGALMALADFDYLMGSTVYRMKIILIVLLVINGGMLVAAEKRAGLIGPEAGWPRLVLMSLISLVLWLVISWLGVRL